MVLFLLNVCALLVCPRQISPLPDMDLPGNAHASFFSASEDAVVIADSVLTGEVFEYCPDLSGMGNVVFSNFICGGENWEADFPCLRYYPAGPGTVQTCIAFCDSIHCDTMYFEIRVFDNFLAAVGDSAQTAYNEPVGISVLANDWISLDDIEAIYLVEPPQRGTAELVVDGTVAYTPAPGFCTGKDQFTYAICNNMGCDTAMVQITLEEGDGVCDGVWPGDVRPDGVVNVIDFWAVGLGFYHQNTGPVRPNASPVWSPQPAPDWGSNITFIEAFDRKHADCNGDGAINKLDYQVIEQNWGQTHNFEAEEKIPLMESDFKISLDFNRLVADTFLWDLKWENAPDSLYGLAFWLEWPAEIGEIKNWKFEPLNPTDGASLDSVQMIRKSLFEGKYEYIALGFRGKTPAGKAIGTLRQVAAEGAKRADPKVARAITLGKNLDIFGVTVQNSGIYPAEQTLTVDKN